MDTVQPTKPLRLQDVLLRFIARNPPVMYICQKKWYLLTHIFLIWDSLRKEGDVLALAIFSSWVVMSMSISLTKVWKYAGPS